MLRALIILVPIALTVFALVDAVQTDDERVQGLPKLAWIALIVLAWVVGPLAWLVAGKKGRRLPAWPGSGGAPPRASRPLAPDDDPEFLRGLGRGLPPPPPEPDRADDGPEPDDPPLSSR